MAKTLDRMLVNICSNDLAKSRDFYVALFDFKVDYDSDWFVHLISEKNKLELGLIDRKHEIVPNNAQGSAEGFYLTFVVDDVDEIHKLAQSRKIKIIDHPKDMFYGQRRLLLQDPNGVTVDISAPLADF
jgi:catechol 2,3-dioxygenase-like lactoylglutathione lyase family enzyme